MSRLVVVSNRVAPIKAGKVAAGGLAVGVYDALRQAGGIWFGWSGEVSATPTINTEEVGNITYVTLPLNKRDYDQYYRGFSNATLWPIFHYRIDLARYSREEYDGYRRVNAMLAEKLMPLLRPDDIIWIHDYHLIPFAEACRQLGVRNRIGFFLHIPFPAPEILTAIPPHNDLLKTLCYYDLIGFQTDTDRLAFQDYITREVRGVIEPDGSLTAYGQNFRAGVYPIGVVPDEIQQLAEGYKAARIPCAAPPTHAARPSSASTGWTTQGSGGAFPRLRGISTATRRTATTSSSCRSRQPALRRAHLPAHPRAAGEPGRAPQRAHVRPRLTPLHYLNKSYDRRVLMGLFRAADVGLSPAARRHEPGRQGIRRRPGPGRSRRAGAVALRRRGPRTDLGADRQPVRLRRHGRSASTGR